MQRGRTLMIVVGLGAAEGFTEDVAAEAVALGLERAAAFAKGVRRAGGTVPVSLLVYDAEDLEAVRVGVAAVIGVS